MNRQRGLLNRKKNKFNHTFRSKPNIVWANGKWRLFQNEWKSQFTTPGNSATHLAAHTINELALKVIEGKAGYLYQ